MWKINPFTGKLSEVNSGSVTDISGKVDKETGKSLVADTEIAKIHATGSDNQDLSSLVVKETGKGLSTNDYSTTEKNKLSGIADGANNYSHPSSHAASMIAQDENNRFSSDTEKTTWDAKVGTNDSRLSDARTPLAHNQTKSTITDFAHTHAESEVTNLTTDLSGKQATLVSGTNIKTVNSNSLLGSGDIAISGGSGGTIVFLGDI